MSEQDDGGWSASADAWIAQMGEAGDLGRRFILDPALTARIGGRGFRRALDVGCGEGRVCRLLRGLGVEPVGVDLTEALLDQARRRDPHGEYRLASGERLPFADASFDLVVSCLTLIDIVDFRAAIAEMARVLAPGGSIVVANLSPLRTAAMGLGWRYGADGAPEAFAIDNWLGEWSAWVEWSGIRVRNWHRPLSAYVSAWLAAGLELVAYEDLRPTGGFDAAEIALHERAPWFDLMEWRKPG